MMEFIKKYVYHALFIVLTVGGVWVANINSKTFDSPEQKVEVVKVVGALPTEAERATSIANDVHAVEIRQLRYEDGKRTDSLHELYERKKDSLVLDQIKRQTVQIEQMKKKIDNIHN